MRRTPDRRIVLSATALTATGLLFVYAFARAVTVEPVAPMGPAPAASPAPVPDEPVAQAKVPTETAITGEALRLAVDNDPFQADRRRPEPYRMPGDAIDVEPTTTAPVAEPPAPPFKLLGTVSMPGSGVALMQVEQTTPLVVNVGEAVMGYTLKTVDITGATLTSRTGTELRLAVAPPSPTGNAGSRGQNGRNAGRNARGNRGNAQRGLSAAAAAAVLERLQASGAPADVIDRLMQQMRGRGVQGTVEIGPPNRIIFRSRVRGDTSNIPVPDAPGVR